MCICETFNTKHHISVEIDALSSILISAFFLYVSSYFLIIIIVTISLSLFLFICPLVSLYTSSSFIFLSLNLSLSLSGSQFFSVSVSLSKSFSVSVSLTLSLSLSPISVYGGEKSSGMQMSSVYRWSTLKCIARSQRLSSAVPSPATCC